MTPDWTGQGVGGPISEPDDATKAFLALVEHFTFHPRSDPEGIAHNAIATLLLLPVEQRMAVMGMERSGWSGHRRGVWNEVGRVHDKASVHMDGCIPLYVEKAR